jgi:hypothetical protein
VTEVRPLLGIIAGNGGEPSRGSDDVIIERRELFSAFSKQTKRLWPHISSTTQGNESRDCTASLECKELNQQDEKW